jgi:hypothetical protein
MARYIVLATSFINNSLAEEDAIVEINDDPARGGMRPGSNLAPVDENGDPVAAKSGRRKPVAGASDLA